ncbi:uncharacterized protein [Cherax quadricarinatus]|uniref:uncharacterized protein n=1 Tax=Cherax quadricarinatus TaxID=27406 RepID=UPI002378F481|nr:uncharacterized protein LOC128699428 [Cherax quadricarinatus]
MHCKIFLLVLVTGFAVSMEIGDSNTVIPDTWRVREEAPSPIPLNITEEEPARAARQEGTDGGGPGKEEEEDDEEEEEDGETDVPWFVPGCRYYCIWKERPYCCDDGTRDLPPDHNIHEGLACPPMDDHICKKDGIYLATYSIKTARYSGSLPLLKGSPKEQMMCASDGYCREEEKCCPSLCAGRHICLPGLLPLRTTVGIPGLEGVKEDNMEEEADGNVMEEGEEQLPQEDREDEKLMEEDGVNMEEEDKEEEEAMHENEE